MIITEFIVINNNLVQHRETAIISVFLTSHCHRNHHYHLYRINIIKSIINTPLLSLSSLSHFHHFRPHHAVVIIIIISTPLSSWHRHRNHFGVISFIFIIAQRSCHWPPKIHVNYAWSKTCNPAMHIANVEVACFGHQMKVNKSFKCY